MKYTIKGMKMNCKSVRSALKKAEQMGVNKVYQGDLEIKPSYRADSSIGCVRYKRTQRRKHS